MNDKAVTNDEFRALAEAALLHGASHQGNCDGQPCSVNRLKDAANPERVIGLLDEIKHTQDANLANAQLRAENKRLRAALKEMMETNHRPADTPFQTEQLFHAMADAALRGEAYRLRRALPLTPFSG